MAMTFEEIASALVASDRPKAQFQVRDIAERLAHGSKHPAFGGSHVLPYTLDEARKAMRAREALIKELLKD